MLPFAALLFFSSLQGAAAPPPAQALAAKGEVPTLSVRELIAEGKTALVPSEKARALAGQRVRLVGFMARQEEPSPGGFWLAARPVECDEGGGGTGDLPPGAVRVIMAGEAPAAIDGPIAVIGVLEVGSTASGDGPASFFRLRVHLPAKPLPPSRRDSRIGA